MRPSRFVATLAGLAALAALGCSGLAFAQQGGAPVASPPAASPPAAAAPAPPATAGEVFGEDVVLAPKTIVYVSGQATWDRAFETIQDAIRTVNGFLQKQGLTAAGPAMTIYTSTDDSGFKFKAGVPIDKAPSPAPQGDLAVGESPSGKALKYVHRGSYDAMDTTYEAITNQLDDKGLEAQDQFVEVYVTDPLTTPEDKLVIEVYVPLR